MKKRVCLLSIPFLCLLLLSGCGATDLPEGLPLSSQTGSPVTGEHSSEETSSDKSSAEGTSSRETSSDGPSSKDASYRFSLPEEFEEMEVAGFAAFYSAADGSSVNLNLQPFDPSFEELSAKLLHQSISTVLSQTYDTEISVTDLSFSRDPVSGFPAYQYSFSYELQGTACTQLVVGVNADQCYTFTYTDLSGNWADAFQDSARAISISVP